jgi:hypothetical protein
MYVANHRTEDATRATKGISQLMFILKLALETKRHGNVRHNQKRIGALQHQRERLEKKLSQHPGLPEGDAWSG